MKRRLKSTRNSAGNIFQWIPMNVEVQFYVSDQERGSVIFATLEILEEIDLTGNNMQMSFIIPGIYSCEIAYVTLHNQ